MSDALFTIEQVLTILAGTSPRLAALTADLSEAQLHTPPNPGEWTANDVLAHLRACADVWGANIRTLLAQDKPTLRALSPRTWIKKTDYPELEFQPSLSAFTTQRADLLSVLEPLPPTDWARIATVTRAGRVYEQAVLNYGERMARHEREHIMQIARIVNVVRSLQEQEEFVIR